MLRHGSFKRNAVFGRQPAEWLKDIRSDSRAACPATRIRCVPQGPGVRHDQPERRRVEPARATELHVQRDVALLSNATSRRPTVSRSHRPSTTSRSSASTARRSPRCARQPQRRPRTRRPSRSSDEAVNARCGVGSARSHTRLGRGCPAARSGNSEGPGLPTGPSPLLVGTTRNSGRCTHL